jgi:RNA-directed DNA polymerase
MLEEILDRRNIEKALKQVEANKGSGGIDGMRWEELRPYINTHWQSLRAELMEGKYKPTAVRKVEIPKPNGGTRMLGIPTVKERLLQQAIAQWLEPRYEAQFSQHSYGYRPGRNAHQAVLQAQAYLNAGKIWVIELDLEQFFDRVSHDKLLGKLRKEITDKGTLRLIRSYLTSGIMEGGIISPRKEGTPQGSPLSPILSNIVLDDLDKELEKRGHSFVRYADDISVYVSSERAAQRAMAGIVEYIEETLKLKVNLQKTQISRPIQSRLLGFSFYRSRKGNWEIGIAKKSMERVKAKCKEITKRSNATSTETKIAKLAQIIRGWVTYFSIARAKGDMEKLDEYVRVRLRMDKWKQWKKPKTRVANLSKLGIPKSKAYQWGNSSKGYCRIARGVVLNTALPKAYFQKLGYIGFSNYYYLKTGKQTSLS